VTAVRSPWAVAGLGALLALALLLPGLGETPFDDPGEGQHAEIAREAWASGKLLDLRLNGVRYFDKPPLLYWLIALDFRAWGPSEWAARLPSVAGAAAAAAATAFLGARLLGPVAGLLAAAALMSCALFAVFGRYVRPETLFAAAIQIGLTGLLLGVTCEGRRARRWAVAGAAALGAASLAKDPLGLLWPLAAVGAALAACGRLRPVRRWLPPSGLVLMLLLGLGWYAWSAIRHPGFLWYVVVDNHLLNAVGLRRFPDEDVPLATGEFMTVAALGAFPWIIPAVLMLGSLVRRRAWRDPEETPWVALALWVVGLWGFFTLSTFKLPHYGLPAYPAIALLAARWWTERTGRSRVPALVHVGLFAILAVGLGLAAGSDGKDFLNAVFSAADVNTRKDSAAAQASPLPPWPAIRPLVTRTALIMAVGAAALALIAWRRAGRWTGAVVAATMLAVMPAATRALDLVAGARAVSGMAAEVRRFTGQGALLAHEGPIENSGALEFYSGRRPVLVEARRSVLGIGATFPDAAGDFWTAEQLAAAWLSGRPILLVTPREPGRSLVSTLPPDRVRLLRAENGRWLYAPITAAVAVTRQQPAGDVVRR
jgi:4-amino-4-deoxy-L-arabinose transferase-like glycosyltransferase